MELLSTAQEKEARQGESMTSALTATTLLNSAHLQLVSGCFGVGLTPDLQDTGPHSQLHHYQVKERHALVVEKMLAEDRFYAEIYGSATMF